MSASARDERWRMRNGLAALPTSRGLAVLRRLDPGRLEVAPVAMRTHVLRNEGGAVIGITGTFDPADVGELRTLARSLCSACSVVLDFHEVDVLDDCAIAKLALELHREIRGSVVLVGLSEHHHRLLQYVGEEAPGAAHLPED